MVWLLWKCIVSWDESPSKARIAEVGEKVKRMLRRAYNTAMTIADASVAAALGKGGLALVSCASANDAMYDAYARGATDEQALACGLEK